MRREGDGGRVPLSLIRHPEMSADAAIVRAERIGLAQAAGVAAGR